MGDRRHSRVLTPVFVPVLSPSLTTGCEPLQAARRLMPVWTPVPSTGVSAQSVLHKCAGHCPIECFGKCFLCPHPLGVLSAASGVCGCKP